MVEQKWKKILKFRDYSQLLKENARNCLDNWSIDSKVCP